MRRMQISVISLMILPSPWLCGSSVVNMSSGTREFGKCVKTQLQLVCSNYGSGEFVTTSLLIKRDFLVWINVIYKGKFQSSRRTCSRKERAWSRAAGPWVSCSPPAGKRAERGAARPALPFHPVIRFLPKVAAAYGALATSTGG